MHGRMRRWAGVAAATVVVATVALIAPAGTSSAGAPKPPKFAGAAPGGVTCALKAKLQFSSPVTSAGGSSSATLRGKLSGCQAAGGAVSIRSAKLSGSFTGSPINCVGPSGGTAPSTLSIAWKGDVDGAVDTVTYGGKASLEATGSRSTGEQLVTGSGGLEELQLLGSGTGSFPGGVSISGVTGDTAAQLTAMCETRTTTPSGTGKGIKKLDIDGTITVGGVGQVTSDGDGFCAALGSGSVDCWGGGANGALGDNSTVNSRVPVATDVTTAVGLASDGQHSYCAVLASGSVDCWGLNTDGELGNGTTGGTDAACSNQCDPTPQAVTGINTAVALASDGGQSYCAVLTSGGVRCWGLGTSGQLGDGTTSSSDVPVAVTGLTGVVALASEGGDSFCAVGTGGSVECWGDNGSGALGDGSTTDSAVPVPVTGLGPAVAVVSDGDHSYCAQLVSGAVSCWGLGTDGELGNGTATTSKVPVGVATVSSAAGLASDGDRSYCAVLTGGPVECWGLNSRGQLGDGTTGGPGPDCGSLCYETPQTVTGVGDAQSIAGDGTNSYCAVLATESVECWGAGTAGQLGNGAGADSDLAVAAAPMGPAVSVVGEGSGTFCSALASDQVDCWGSNASGALGDGAPGSPLVPVQVSDLVL